MSKNKTAAPGKSSKPMTPAAAQRIQRSVDSKTAQSASAQGFKSRAMSAATKN